MNFRFLNELLQQSENLYNELDYSQENIENELINEFHINIISSNSKQAKEGVFIHYLSELAKSHSCITEYYGKNHAMFSNSVYKLFHELFVEVEKYCAYFGFDIFRLSKLTGFEIQNVARVGFEQEEEEETNNEDFLDLSFNEGQQKIIFLQELGVIDYLRREYNNPSNTKLGEILKPITDLRPDTIRKYLERIATNEINDSSKSVVINAINQLKITKRKE